MDATFPALLIRDQVQGPERIDFIRMGEADLMPGDVEVAVHYSSLNYKDALGITGSGRVLRRSPLVGGIDAAGEVIASSDTRFKPGDAVLVTGAGLGEYHHGGFAGRIRVPADWVVPLPAGMDCRQAMILGTAGLTTALIFKRFQENHQLPEMGPILVTGASGGVGALTISLLASRGYEVVALTGKPEMAPWLRSMGASEVLDRHGLSMGFRPLETVRWGGAVDVLGGEVLGWLARTVDDWGNIVVVGLAGGADLRTTVMPFILRGVSLLGVTSANCPLPLRRPLWEQLAGDWRIPHLDVILSEEIALSQLPEASRRMLAGRTWGRILVNLRSET